MKNPLHLSGIRRGVARLSAEREARRPQRDGQRRPTSDALEAGIGDLLAGRTSFAVKLSDFGVKGMEGVVGARVSETIQVDVSFVASSKSPEAM